MPSFYDFLAVLVRKFGDANESFRCFLPLAISRIHFTGNLKVSSFEAANVSSVLHKDPITDTVFVFRSRRVDRLKSLYWDGIGVAYDFQT